jgi:hypothetical protein
MKMKKTKKKIIKKPSNRNEVLKYDNYDKLPRFT